MTRIVAAPPSLPAHPLVRGVLVAVGLTLVASCGSSPGPTGTATPQGTSTARTADAPQCLPDATALVAGTDTDPTLVAVVGEGARGVVLAPQNGGDWCQWADEARRLADDGYHVATFGWASDEATSLPGAVAVLREQGATEVALVGASMGGGWSAALADELDAVAVVALSPPSGDPGPDATAVSSTYAGPLLVVASAADTNVEPAQSRLVARDDSTYLEVPGRAHGVAMLVGDSGPLVQSRIDAVLADAFTD